MQRQLILHQTAMFILQRGRMGPVNRVNQRQSLLLALLQCQQAEERESQPEPSFLPVQKVRSFTLSTMLRKSRTLAIANLKGH